MKPTKPKKAFLIKFGQSVRAERQRLGWSQQQLAEEAGLHRTYIGMIERGEKNITLGNIVKIAATFGIEPSSLLEDL